MRIQRAESKLSLSNITEVVTSHKVLQLKEKLSE